MYRWVFFISKQKKIQFNLSEKLPFFYLVQIKTEKSLACTIWECSDLKASCLITVNITEAASLRDLARALITFKALQNEELYSYKQGYCQLLSWQQGAGENTSPWLCPLLSMLLCIEESPVCVQLPICFLSCQRQERNHLSIITTC